MAPNGVRVSIYKTTMEVGVDREGQIGMKSGCYRRGVTANKGEWDALGLHLPHREGPAELHVYGERPTANRTNKTPTSDG